MTKYIAYALILMCQTTCNKSGVRFGRVKMGCGRIDKLDAEQCSRGWRYESCHHFRLENSIYFPGREIVGNAQRNVLMLSLTFQRQQHTAAPTTGPLQLDIQNHQGHIISFDVLFRYMGEGKDPFQ